MSADLHPWGPRDAHTPGGSISLRDLSDLVAERNHLEQLGVPRLTVIEAGRPPGRARRRAWAAGRRRTSYVGPRMSKDAA